jgi:hypothetical protein
VELLQFELVNLTMAKGEKLKSYWSRGISIRRRLEDLLQVTTDTTLLMWLMAGLPPCWKTYRAIAKHNPGANQGVYEMLRFLQPEETNMLKEELASKASGSHGHSGSRSHEPYHPSSNGHDQHLPLPPPFAAYSTRTFDGVCWRCNKPGHRSSECSSPSPLCEHCGKPGHTAATCFFLHGFPSRNGNGRPATNQRSSDQHQQRPRSRSRSPGPARRGTPGPVRPPGGTLQHLTLPPA